ncbi:uncharacterized protein LOC128552849 isoform X2 [Mercenaria mercenaria]|uniref:uncharacterized protein LOC128552849 isoform X2 n=1 Tax=Mercenaria mercenaria TaxID=6596 RepID=UPI00234E3A69|nr:uncharacterized protein LOC128552849 isoform X2 [Mercenaria mercenaria]
MMSAEQKEKLIHVSLLTSISNKMVETEKEYENFIIHMGVYVDPGLLEQHKTILGKLSALEKKKFLGPGNYKILKEICINSENNYLTDDIATAEKEIMRVRKEYGEGAKAGSKQSNSVAECTNDINQQTQQRNRNEITRKRPASDGSDQAPFESKQAKHTSYSTTEVQQEYSRWYYAWLGLRCVLDVLKPFCNEIVNEQHRVILSKVKQKHNINNIACGQCILMELKPDHARDRQKCPFGKFKCNCQYTGTNVCPKNICGAIYDEIIELHTFKRPAQDWRNTDIQKWCSDPWSIAKCFISTSGYACKNISNIDITGILQLIYNNMGFCSHITNMDHIAKVREWRNKFTHSNILELDEMEFDEFFHDLTTLLVEEPELKTRPETEGVMKILQSLMDMQNPFDINTKVETDVLLYIRQSIKDINQSIKYSTNKTATNEDRSSSEQPDASRRFTRQLEREIEGMKQAKRKQLANAEAILDETFPGELEKDPLTRQLYNKALQNDRSEETSIQVMVIGCYNHGKTSLVRRLLGQKLDGKESTNGIEVHRCIAKPNGMWEEVKTEELEHNLFRQHAKRAQGVLPPETEKEESTPHNVLPDEDSVTKARMKKCVHEHDKENVLLSSDASYKNQSKNIFQTFTKEFHKPLDTKRNLNDFIDLSILDLSGQFTYYATHPILLSTRAVYILVINLKDDLNEILTYSDNPGETPTKSLREYISFWVNSIHTFVGTEDGYCPPIILVGTHKDEIDTDESKVFADVRDLFQNSSALNHLQLETFSVSNTETELSEDDFISLRSLIIKVGKQQPMKKIPGKWLLLEYELKMRSKHQKIIKLSELCKIALEVDSQILRGIKNEDMDQLKLFLTFHHIRGTLCYFNVGKLSEYVVIDPIFLIDAFKCLITSKKKLKARYPLNKMWKKLCDTAILEPELIKNVWSGDFLKFQNLLLQFLQGHHIISNVQKYNEQHDFCIVQSAGYYIVPSFLKSSVNSDQIKTFLLGKTTSKVSLRYENISQKVLPILFNRILAALVGKWPISNLDEVPLIFDNFVACEPKRDHAVLLFQEENGIELLTVSLLNKAVSSEICDVFRRFVEKIMKEEIYKLRSRNVQHSEELFSVTVRCRDSFHEYKGSTFTCDLHEIKNSDSEIPCPDKRNHIVKSDYIRQWFPDRNSIVSRSSQTGTRRLTAKEYSKLAQKIGRNWKQFAETLGFCKDTIEQIEMDDFLQQFRVYQLLLKWDEKEGENATLDKLAEAVLQTPGLSADLDEIKNLVNDL